MSRYGSPKGQPIGDPEGTEDDEREGWIEEVTDAMMASSNKRKGNDNSQGGRKKARANQAVAGPSNSNARGTRTPTAARRPSNKRPLASSSRPSVAPRRRQHNTNPGLWNTRMVLRMLALFQLLQDNGKQTSSNNWKQVDLRSVAATISQEFGVTVSDKQVSNKWTAIKGTWTEWHVHLRHVSGWGVEDGIPVNNDEEEDEHFTANPKCLKFKRQLPPFHDECQRLIGDNIATGDFAEDGEELGQSSDDGVDEEDDGYQAEPEPPTPTPGVRRSTAARSHRANDTDIFTALSNAFEPIVRVMENAAVERNRVPETPVQRAVKRLMDPKLLKRVSDEDRLFLVNEISIQHTLSELMLALDDKQFERFAINKLSIHKPHWQALPSRRGSRAPSMAPSATPGPSASQASMASAQSPGPSQYGIAPSPSPYESQVCMGSMPPPPSPYMSGGVGGWRPM